MIICVNFLVSFQSSVCGEAMACRKMYLTVFIGITDILKQDNIYIFMFYFRWLEKEAQRAKENRRKLKASGDPVKIQNIQDKTCKR